MDPLTKLKTGQVWYAHERQMHVLIEHLTVFICTRHHIAGSRSVPTLERWCEQFERGYANVDLLEGRFSLVGIYMSSYLPRHIQPQ